MVRDCIMQTPDTANVGSDKTSLGGTEKTRQHPRRDGISILDSEIGSQFMFLCSNSLVPKLLKANMQVCQAIGKASAIMAFFAKGFERKSVCVQFNFGLILKYRTYFLWRECN